MNRSTSVRAFTSAACVCAALLLTAAGAAAQERRDVEPWLGLDLLTGSVEGQAAENGGTGTRLWGAQFSGGVTVVQLVNLTGEIGGVGMADDDAFTTPTTGGDKTSSVTGLIGSISAGLQAPAIRTGAGSPSVVLGVNAGSTWLNVRRGIENCEDCPQEDVELQAGTFWEPALLLDWGRHGLSVRYRVYGEGSDLRDGLFIGLTSILGGNAPPADADTDEAPR